MRIARPSSSVLRPAPAQGDGAGFAPSWADTARARLAIQEENRSAAGLSPSDARWVLALRTAQLLQGGRAGILPPADRRRLHAMAQRMGLRPFDASLVIAIVQDGAREGDPLGENCEDRLRLVRPPAPDTGLSVWWAAACSVLLAVVFIAVAMRWITGES